MAFVFYATADGFCFICSPTPSKTWLHILCGAVDGFCFLCYPNPTTTRRHVLCDAVPMTKFIQNNRDLRHIYVNKQNVDVIRTQHPWRCSLSYSAAFRNGSWTEANADGLSVALKSRPSRYRRQNVLLMSYRICCHLRITICLPSRYRVVELEVLISLMSTLQSSELWGRADW
jgi:hypothetical protein